MKCGASFGESEGGLAFGYCTRRVGLLSLCENLNAKKEITVFFDR